MNRLTMYASAFFIDYVTIARVLLMVSTTCGLVFALISFALETEITCGVPVVPFYVLFHLMATVLGFMMLYFCSDYAAEYLDYNMPSTFTVRVGGNVLKTEPYLVRYEFNSKYQKLKKKDGDDPKRLLPMRLPFLDYLKMYYGGVVTLHSKNNELTLTLD